MKFANRASGAGAASAAAHRTARSPVRRIGLRVGVAAAASGALAAGALALMPMVSASLSSNSGKIDSSNSGGPTAYSFTTLNNNNDPTFNQLLGINEHGLIAGYFGSGASGHPNQGYLLQRPSGQANYVAAKAGIIGLTKAIAIEIASRNITVNAVAPGFIETPMTDVLPEKVKEELKTRIPLGRMGSARDVAAAIVFLASDEAAYITGHVLNVNGGLHLA